MKNIWLVKDQSTFWGTVEVYLNGANARVSNMDAGALGAGLENGTPELIITGREHFDALSRLPRELPRLVLARDVQGSDSSRGVYFLKWPVARESFLEITSRLLYISGRRLFNTVISVSPKGSDDIFLGKSMNFSTTGVAFKLERELAVGDLIILSFFTPGAKDQLCVEAQVMRRSENPDDGGEYYGARFINVSGDVGRELESFVNGIR